MSHRILIVQHEDACPPALLGQWLLDAGLSLDVRRPDRGQALPLELTGYDALLVLGGSMDAEDEAGYPWLGDTVGLLRRAVDEDLPTLGICLGHQLLARACGGRVARNPLGRQLGLLTMGLTVAAGQDRLFGVLGVGSRCLQWNQDIVVELPGDAVVLAATPAREPQLVRFAHRAWGIQAHPEVDDRLLQWWVDDPTSHVVRQEAERVVAEVAMARAELEATWRPLTTMFASLVRAEHRVRR